MGLPKTPTRVGSALAVLLSASLPSAQEATPARPPAPALEATQPPAVPSNPGPTAEDPRTEEQPGATPTASPPAPSAEPKQPTGVPGFTSAPLPTPAPVPASPPPGQPRVIQVVEDEPVDDTDYYQEPLGRHQDHWFAWLGGRSTLVRDPRFDMFSTDDALTGFSLGVGRILARSQRLSGGAFATWDIAGRGSDARGDDTSLLVQKILLGGEARYHLHHRWYAFVRGAAGLGHVGADIDSNLTKVTSSSSSNEFAADLKAGTTFELAGPADGGRRTPRIWLSIEGGYTYLTKSTLEFVPEADQGPERAQPLSAGEISLSGLAFGVSLIGSY